MEIIFLVFLNFSGGNMDGVHYYNYYNLAEQEKLSEISCSAYIKKPAFKSFIRLSFRSTTEVRAKCMSPSELSGLKTVVTKAKNWPVLKVR